MELREDVSFDLKGFSPWRLSPLPGQGCLVVASDSGRLLSLDLVSGTEIHSAGTRWLAHHEGEGKVGGVGVGATIGLWCY